MGYTAVFTAVAGTVIRSADANSGYRDNLNHHDAVISGTDDRLISPKAWGDRPKGTLPVVLGASDTTLYTCPANTVALVTMVRVALNTGGLTVTVKAKGKYLAKSKAVGQYSTHEIPCFVLLSAGETVLGSCSSASGAIGSVVVWEIPSTYSGLTFQVATGTVINASTWTTLITPTAGKNLVARFVALEFGATPPTRVVLGVGTLDAYEVPGADANSVWVWAGEIQVPPSSTLKVWVDQATVGWIAGGWEEA